MSLQSILKHSVSCGALGLLLIAHSPQNAQAASKTDAFIETHVLETLSNWPEPGTQIDRGVISEQLSGFVDLERIAEFTLGKYGKRFSAPELQDFKAIFRDYVCEYVYAILSAHRHSNVLITNSHERRVNDVIVSTDIISPTGETISLHWRLLVRGDDISVLDVAMSDQGNNIWLAMELRAQFVAVLDRNFGNPVALNNYLQSQINDLG